MTAPSVELDELAIGMVVEDGFRMKLKGPDRVEAFRRMYGKIEIDHVEFRLYINRNQFKYLVKKLKLKGGYNSDGRPLLTDEYLNHWQPGWDWWQRRRAKDA